MAAGDIITYGPTTPAKLDALMTGGGTVVADDVTMCSYASGLVFVLVVKAA